MAPDSIVLSGTVETQYSGKALEVFTRMAALSDELGRLSKRNSSDMTSKELARRCLKCRLAPSKVFGGLSAKLGLDIGGFYLEFRERSIKVADAELHDPVCRKCVLSTKDDLGFILERFEGFARFVVKEGFKVVL